MHLEKRVAGNYRIVATARPSTPGGFVAAVSIQPLDANAGDVLFAEDRLAKGFVFRDPSAALRYAFDVGHSRLRAQPVRA